MKQRRMLFFCALGVAGTPWVLSPGMGGDVTCTIRFCNDDVNCFCYLQVLLLPTFALRCNEPCG